MYNQGQNLALPVPADQLISGNWIQDPMTVQLPVPQKPVFAQNPNIQWVLALTAATMVSCLQENCQGGPVSAFAYNLFSQNGYSNNFWLLIVDEASDFALQQLQVMQQGSNPQQVVAAAARFYAGYAAAACVPKWPALQQIIMSIDPNMMVRINQVIGQWTSLQGANQNNMGMYTPQGPAQNRGPWGTGSSDVGQFATNNVGISATPLGNLAYNAATHDENSKYGNAHKKKAVPDGRKPNPVAPTDELAALGVVQVDTIGRAMEQPVQVQQPATRSVPARRKPEPITIDQATGQEVQAQPVQPVEQAGLGEWPLPTNITGVAGQIPSTVSMSNDIPNLDVLGPDDSAWADQMDGGHVTFANEPRDEYIIDTPGRFMVRPKHVEITLPDNRDDAELEDPEDLELIEVVGPTLEPLENGQPNLTMLQLEDGNVALQVTAKDIGRTWTVQQPHNFPYDPQKFLRYFVHTDAEGTYEAFLPRDPDVEYIDLEFDGAKRAAARQQRLSAQTILPDLSVLQDIQPRGTPYTIIGAVDHLNALEGDADQTKLLDQVELFQGKISFFESSAGQLELDATLFQVDRFFEQVKAKNAVAATFGKYTRDFIVPGIASRVNDINSSPISEKLAKVIMFVRDIEQFNPRAFLYLDNLFAKEVNRTLDYACGMDAYSITSFSEDYFDLSNLIEEELGEAAFTKLNEAVGSTLLTYSFSYSGTTLKVEHAYGVIGLPVGLTSFKLQTAAGESYVVTASMAPELYNLLEEVKRDEGTPPHAKTYLIGRDGELFEIVASAWDDGFKTLVRV